MLPFRLKGLSRYLYPDMPSPAAESRYICPASTQTLRDTYWRLEQVVRDLETAEVQTGRRLWHAERRLREGHTRWEEPWQLEQTVDAARRLDTAVKDGLSGVRTSLLGLDRVLAEAHAASPPPAHRAGPAVSDVWTQLTSQDYPGRGYSDTTYPRDVGTQTGYLFPAGTIPDRQSPAVGTPGPSRPAAWCHNPVGAEDPNSLLLPRVLREAGASSFSSVEPADAVPTPGTASQPTIDVPPGLPQERGRTLARSSSRTNKCPHRDVRLGQ